MSKRYPRDMLGHGENPPHSEWPNAARIAIQIVVNYEEGGENCTLHGDKASEAFLSEIVGAQPWENQRHWNMESIYEYGARAGFWRLHRILTSKNIPVTVFGVATALQRSPIQVEAMKAAGWEIASHGLKWIEYKDYTVEDEREAIEEAIKLHEVVIGEKPRGWYTGRCSENTVQLIAERGDFDYISDSYADDLPYWIEADDQNQLIVPYTLDCNDMRFATAQGFNSGDQFYAYLKDTFDTLYEEGKAGHPRMMNIGLHCRLAGRPGRAASLARFLDYAQSHEAIWFARRIDIAEHWKATHPYQRKNLVPTKMQRQTFVETFGSIFEHSPWIAEQTFDAELGPAHNLAAGLHNAMTIQFRLAETTKKLEVLNAHPDLAGRLAAAKKLTKESESEQASAGLDALTNGERKEFQSLNSTYTSKFGFPFIIAVKGRNKKEILAAFNERIGNSPEQEFETACREVEKIARIRLEVLFAEDTEVSKNV